MIGCYFTRGNPFAFAAFREWMECAPEGAILEPFAGDGSIPRLMEEAGYRRVWRMCDIEPRGDGIEARDSLADFPSGFAMAVTNPPWLARNSAMRRGIAIDFGGRDDLYKLCLDRILAGCGWAAAILPESFIVSRFPKGRLRSVISLGMRMFEDTAAPSCLAMFGPDGRDAFDIWHNGRRVGDSRTLAGLLPDAPANAWRFNDPAGEIGIRCADNTRCASLAFVPGEELAAERIKPSGRHVVRVSGLPERADRKGFLAGCNRILAGFRERGGDFLLAPFKALRRDGMYRRRLDFGTARRIMDLALLETS